MHEHGLGACLGHELAVDLIGEQVRDALGPDLVRLAHGHPHVGVDHVRALHGLLRLGAEVQGRAGPGGDLPAGFDQRGIGEVFLRGAGHKVHAHLCTAHHQRVAHVVAGVAHVHQLDPFKRSEVLPDGQEIRQDLRGVELVGQPVEHRHPGIVRQGVHDLLAVAPVLDAVEHPAQHPGGVGDGLLLADLGALGVQIGAAHAQVRGRDLEGAAGAGGGFFKDQGDVFSGEHPVGDAALFLRLQRGGDVQEVGDLCRREVQQLEKVLLIHIVTPLCGFR